MLAAWSHVVPTSPPSRFVSANFDAVVFAATGGLGDTGSNILVQRNVQSQIPESQGLGLAMLPFYNAQRINGFLKLDNASDLLSPGVGSGALQASNSISVLPPVAMTHRLENPIVLLDFVLTLDGTVGRRDFSAVFQPAGSTGPSNTVGIFDGVANVSAPVTQSPASLLVIPSAPSFGLVAAAAIVVLRRRR